MTGETYAMVADKGYEPKTLLLRVNDSADEYALSAALSKRTAYPPFPSSPIRAI